MDTGKPTQLDSVLGVGQCREIAMMPRPVYANYASNGCPDPGPVPAPERYRVATW